MTALNYFFYKRFAHNLPMFLIGKILLNIGICQTLRFSILKMSPRSIFLYFLFLNKYRYLHVSKSFVLCYCIFDILCDYIPVFPTYL
jgi:hypothetical protein